MVVFPRSTPATVRAQLKAGASETACGIQPPLIFVFFGHESPTRNGYLKISSSSGLRRKLLQELNRIGQLEIATICGMRATRVM
jgi:hypothetical protein